MEKHFESAFNSGEEEREEQTNTETEATFEQAEPEEKHLEEQHNFARETIGDSGVASTNPQEEPEYRNALQERQDNESASENPEMQAQQIYGLHYHDSQMARSLSKMEQRRQELLEKESTGQCTLGEAVELVLMGQDADYTYDSHYFVTIAFHPDHSADVYDYGNDQDIHYQVRLGEPLQSQSRVEKFAYKTLQNIEVLQSLIPRIPFGTLERMGGLPEMLEALNRVQTMLEYNDNDDEVQRLLQVRSRRPLRDRLSHGDGDQD